ncbi:MULTISPECIES: ABC transporter permease [Cupriavidus]
MFEPHHHARGPSWRAILRESKDGLWLSARRSLLALLGIAVGCGSIIALLNIGRNAAEESMRTFKDMGTNLLIVRFPYIAGKSRSLPSNVDIEVLTRAVPTVVQVAPIALQSARIRQGGRRADGSVVGTTSSLATLIGLRLDAGRFLSGHDGLSTFAVIGANVARKLGVANRSLRPGDVLQVEGYLFDVIGVLRPHAANPVAPTPVDDAIFIPIDGLRRIRANPEMDSLIAVVGEGDEVSATAEALRQHLAEGIRGRDIDIQIPQKMLEALQRQARTFSYLLAGMAGISLLVGGVGVVNVMLMSVAARRREIGVRMALGARARDIRLLFLLEAACLSVIGAAMGVAIGLATAYLFARLSGWTYVLAPASLFLGVSSSMATGLLFGLYPAASAARLRPIQALRDV